MSKSVSIDFLNKVAARTTFSVFEISRNVDDIFNGCIGLGFSEKEAQNMCIQYCCMLTNSYAYVTPASFIDLIRGPIISTDCAFMPDTIAYPAIQSYVTTSATGFTPAQNPKKKSHQKHKPKPKNRTVYRCR